MSKRDDAKADYLIGKSYKDIADKYGVSAATVRTWKSRYKWDDTSVTTQSNKHDETQQKSATKVQHVATQQIIENDELNEKQKLFCVYYLQRFNATWAYMKAYKASYEVANKNAPALMVKHGIKEQIQDLKKQVTEEAMIELIDLIKDDAKQAFADLGDYINFGNYEEYVTDQVGVNFVDTDGNPIVAHKSWVQLKDKSEVDTSLIEEVTNGKDGAKVKLKSADKAKERLYKYFSNSDKENNGMDMVAKLLGTIVKGADKDGNTTE